MGSLMMGHGIIVIASNGSSLAWRTTTPLRSRKLITGLKRSGMPSKHKAAVPPRRKASTRTNAISLLKGDHQRVRLLLRRLENTTDRATTQRRDLLSEIENEVKVHTTVE